jgi:sigma-B regulation protein RsbU (phosphoserine phosphatase)
VTETDLKILVVEDDPVYARVLEKRLKSEGFLVQCAGDGREGMKAIVSYDPDLVISDWMMPHVDGLELCQSVKTGLGDAAPYFILLTAKGEINDRLLALETGADDYLVKPCEQGELMARVRSGLRSVHLTRQLRRVMGELEAARAELESTRRSIRELTESLAYCGDCGRVESGAGAWDTLARFMEGQNVLRFRRTQCPTCREGTLARRGEGT